jgi:hypothetical protein
MDTAELLKKVRKIEIKTRGLSKHLFSGEYHSAFKGRGMSFSEVREYAYGDEVRSIDWNVTARTGDPHVKVFEEERELTVMLVADLSRSELFGSGDQDKRTFLTEVAAVLAFSASQNNDKVGLLIFTEKVELYIPTEEGPQAHTAHHPRAAALRTAAGRYGDRAGPGVHHGYPEKAQHLLYPVGLYRRGLRDASADYGAAPRRGGPAGRGPAGGGDTARGPVATCARPGNGPDGLARQFFGQPPQALPRASGKPRQGHWPRPSGRPSATTSAFRYTGVVRGAVDAVFQKTSWPMRALLIATYCLFLSGNALRSGPVGAPCGQQPAPGRQPARRRHRVDERGRFFAVDRPARRARHALRRSRSSG